MSPSALGAVLLVHLLPRGVLVEASGTAEARATSLGSADEETARARALQVGSLVLNPTITAAISGTGEHALNARASYAPMISTLSGDVPLVALLHNATAQGALELTRRLHVRTAANMVLGDLDPASVQAALRRTGALVDSTLRLPSVAGTVRTDIRARLTPLVTVDAGVQLDGAQTADQDLLPGSAAFGGEAMLAWHPRRRDTLWFRGRGRTIDISEHGRVDGIAPAMGWQHQTSPHGYVEFSAGAGGFSVLDSEGERTTHLLPTGEIRSVARLGLPGAATIDVLGGLQTDVVTDPLGALLEQRAGGHVGVVWRPSRTISLTSDMSAFLPLLLVDLPERPLADTTVFVQCAGAWSITSHLSVQAQVMSTSRWFDGRVVTDVTVGTSISSAFALVHRGTPAQDSDIRGRSMGLAPWGVFPPDRGTAESFRRANVGDLRDPGSAMEWPEDTETTDAPPEVENGRGDNIHGDMTEELLPAPANGNSRSQHGVNPAAVPKPGAPESSPTFMNALDDPGEGPVASPTARPRKRHRSPRHPTTVHQGPAEREDAALTDAVDEATDDAQRKDDAAEGDGDAPHTTDHRER